MCIFLDSVCRESGYLVELVVHYKAMEESSPDG